MTCRLRSYWRAFLRAARLFMAGSELLEAGGGTDAFLFSNGVMTDLNSLISPGSSFTLHRAASISNTGFIVGYGTNSAGQQDAFLLTPNTSPVPEASTTVSLGLLLGFGGFILAMRRPRRPQAR